MTASKAARGLLAKAKLSTSTAWLIAAMFHIDVMIVIFYVTTPTSTIEVGKITIYTTSYRNLSILCMIECGMFDLLMLGLVVRRMRCRSRAHQGSHPGAKTTTAMEARNQRNTKSPIRVLNRLYSWEVDRP